MNKLQMGTFVLSERYNLLGDRYENINSEKQFSRTLTQNYIIKTSENMILKVSISIYLRRVLCEIKAKK